MIELLPKPYVKPDGMSETMSQEFARMGITQSKVFLGGAACNRGWMLNKLGFCLTVKKLRFAKKKDWDSI